MISVAKCVWVLVLASLPAGVGCAHRPPASPLQSGFKAGAPGLEAIQSRHLHRLPEAAVIDVAGAVLEELGYTLEKREETLGALSASKSGVHKHAIKRGAFALIAAPVAVALGTMGIALGDSVAEAKNSVWPDTVDFPCVDRVLLTTAPGGTEGKCCLVRLVVQRAFPGDGENRYAGGWVVADGALYQEFYRRLEARLALVQRL